MGLIDSAAPPSSFWPGCFANGGQIDEELEKHNAHLDREVLVDSCMLEIGRATTIPSRSLTSAKLQ